MRPGLTHDLWRTRKSASHSTESIVEDVSVTNLHRNVTSHQAGLERSRPAADATREANGTLVA